MDENLRFSSELAHTASDSLPRQLKPAKDDLAHKRAQLRAISKSPSPRSPKEEAAYKALALNYGKTQAFYKNLLTETSESVLWVGGVSKPPLGKYVHIVTADVPQSPSSPKRLLFSLCGLGVGLLLGIGRVLCCPSRGSTGS